MVDESKLLQMHHRHLIACGVPEARAYAVDAFPTTRNDLRVHYTAIEEGTVARPKWAQEQPS